MSITRFKCIFSTELAHSPRNLFPATTYNPFFEEAGLFLIRVTWPIYDVVEYAVIGCWNASWVTTKHVLDRENNSGMFFTNINSFTGTNEVRVTPINAESYEDSFETTFSGRKHNNNFYLSSEPLLIRAFPTESGPSRICRSLRSPRNTQFLLCCALLWLYIDWFSHIHQAYFTGTVAI